MGTVGEVRLQMVNAMTETPYEVTDLDDDDESALEVEEEDPDDPITEPFDPEQIRIRTIPVLIQQLTERIAYEEVDLTPDFQRLRGIWDIKRKSRLIESLLLRIPIPVFYVAADDDDNWTVVDGVQRMSTINDFVTGQFKLKSLEYLVRFNGDSHADLPRGMQRRISETQLVVNVIEPGTPPEVMFNVFLRINTGGMRLNSQEIRHAIYPGPVREYLAELATSEEFLKATGGTIRPIRMDDRECVLRFLAFYIQPWEEYTASDLNGYLGSTMKRINDMGQKGRDELASDFRKAMLAAYAIFGEGAFRKPSNRKVGRSKISRALFEVWSVQLARCSRYDIDNLICQKDEVGENFEDLVNSDDDFERSISYSTGTSWRVHKRFEAIQELVQEFI